MLKRVKDNLFRILICIAAIVCFFSMGKAYFAVNAYHGRWVQDIWNDLYSLSRIMLIVIVIIYAYICLKENKKPKVWVILMAIAFCLAAYGFNNSITGSTFMYSDVKFVESAWHEKELYPYNYMILADSAGALHMVNLTGEEIHPDKTCSLVDGIYLRSVFGQQFWIKKVAYF